MVILELPIPDDIMLLMAWEVSFFMVGSAPSLSHAAIDILHRVHPLGFRRTTDFHEILGEGRRTVDTDEDGWEVKIDAWSDVFFAVLKQGPSLTIHLTKLSGTTIRAWLEIEGNSLNHYFKNGRLHEVFFYAPLFQVALALGADSGVGDFEMDEFEPTSEKEIEEAIFRDPENPELPHRLGFLRKLPKPDPKGFILTNRPEGYWLLEHESFIRFLAC